MKLKYANIVNFRSIQNATIDFDPACRVLVGINESGKSNILRALSTISNSTPLTPQDNREPLPNEKSIDKAYIRFVFELDKIDVDKVYSETEPKILTENIEDTIINDSTKQLSLRGFCDSINKGIFEVNLIKQTKYATYFVLPEKYKILTNWKKPSSACPVAFCIESKPTKPQLKKYSLVNVNEYSDIPAEYLENVNAEYLNDLIGEKIKEIIENSLPEVIFWKYDEANLLPPTVNIATFSANPDCCVPLKNMFMLAGISNIADEINKAKQSPNKLRNLLTRVATHTTKHFRNVWKEYKEISFALEPNGSNIEPNIVEKNHWQMSQRSDGLKRFITFLLHISANVKTDILNDSILLVDEPDMGLHPSGCRYLRDELIEIGKKNYVVFSTHSIFMIDKDNIGRHLIVKKTQEKTEVENASKSNFVDEEVLFNALNYTVFDILKRDNIIFEGWRDKKLFQTSLDKIPTTYSKNLEKLRERLKSLGLCHAAGVKDVKNLTPLLELANRRCLIVSDGDAPAKEKQKEHQESHGYGIWVRYDEISKGFKAETGEDFIKEDVFKNYLLKIKIDFSSLSGEPVTTGAGRLENVKKWMSRQGIASDEIMKSLNELKGNIFNNLKAADIDATYYDFLIDFLAFIDSAIPESK